MVDKKIIYKSIRDRYCRMAWTHKIQEAQGDIHMSNGKVIWVLKVVFSCIVAGGLITILGDCFEEEKWVKLVTASIATVNAVLVCIFNDGRYEQKATQNKSFAAKCHHLRNEYESLLCDYKSNAVSDEQAIQQRNALEGEENILFSQVVPHTGRRAVRKAGMHLKNRQDDITTQEEIETIISEQLRDL